MSGNSISMWIDVVAWSLLHFIWQAAVVAALLMAAVRVRRFRYAMLTSGMLSLFVVFAVTARMQWLSTEPEASVATIPAASDLSNPASGVRFDSANVQNGNPSEHTSQVALQVGGNEQSESSIVSIPSINTEMATPQLWQLNVRRWQHWVVGAWMLGIVLLAGRLGRDWLAVCRLSRSSTPIPATSPWAVSLGVLSKRLGIRRKIHLLASSGVTVPVYVWRLSSSHRRALVAVVRSASGSGRSDPVARTGSHSTPRLSGQSAPVGDGNRLLFSPGCLVDFPPDANRT